jgi:hypothetical protein
MSSTNKREALLKRFAGSVLKFSRRETWPTISADWWGNGMGIGWTLG